MMLTNEDKEITPSVRLKIFYSVLVAAGWVYCEDNEFLIPENLKKTFIDEFKVSRDDLEKVKGRLTFSVALAVQATYDRALCSREALAAVVPAGMA